MDKQPKISSLCRHKGTQRAYIRFQGKIHYLGPWPNGYKKAPPEVLSRYQDFLVQVRLAPKAPDPVKPGDQVSTVATIAAKYHIHAKDYYASNPTEILNIELAIEPLAKLYGSIPSASFNSSCLEFVQSSMVDSGLARSTVNKRVGLIRRIFNWAERKGLVGPEVLVSLKNTRPLKKGHTRAPEAVKKKAVPDSIVDKTLEFCHPQLAAMIELCRWSGCRPGECCSLSLDQIDRSEDDIWFFIPSQHKMASRGFQRVVALVPLVIEKVKPFLDEGNPSAPVFSPRKAMLELWNEKRRPDKKDSIPLARLAKLKEQYTVHSFNNAIRRICKKNGITHWTAQQLRKASADKAQRIAGDQGASDWLGHDSTTVTKQFYLSGPDRERLKKVALGMAPPEKILKLKENAS